MEDLKKPWAPAIFFWLGMAVCVGTTYQLWPDRAYYFLSPAARLLHPHHAILRSSGKGGLSFGAVATLLILVNLSYLIRKRLVHLTWLGSLRSWMAFHVFTGLVAGAMVLLHSALLLRSALGTLAFSAMAIVMATGLVGRYIYAHTPRSLKGKEMELEDIRRDFLSIQSQMERMGLPKEAFSHSFAAQAPTAGDKDFFSSIGAMIEGDRAARREYRDLRTYIRRHSALKAVSKQILPLAQRYSRERQWIARYQELRSLMGSWRFLHRWFAIILLGAVGFHILVAVQMGNLWLVEAFRSHFSAR